MPKIVENDIFTQVVTFEVAPGKQDALIEALTREVERWVRFRAGFISSTFHASLDGRHVLNYAQWRSRGDMEGFAQDPQSSRLSAAVQAVGPDAGPHATGYRVIRVIEPPTGT